MSIRQDFLKCWTHNRPSVSLLHPLLITIIGRNKWDAELQSNITEPILLLLTFICNGSTVENPEGLGDRAVNGCMGRADEPDDGAGWITGLGMATIVGVTTWPLRPGMGVKCAMEIWGLLLQKGTVGIVVGLLLDVEIVLWEIAMEAELEMTASPEVPVEEIVEAVATEVAASCCFRARFRFDVDEKTEVIWWRGDRMQEQMAECNGERIGPVETAGDGGVVNPVEIEGNRAGAMLIGTTWGTVAADEGVTTDECTDVYRYDGAGDTLAGTERLNGFSNDALVSVATEDTAEQVVDAFVTAETQPP